MTETKFTKGEWDVDKVYSIAVGCCYSGKYEVRSDDFSGCANEQGEANAHLIKTAPKLYERIEQMNTLLESLGPGVWGKVDLGVATHLNEELLAEARGEIK